MAAEKLETLVNPKLKPSASWTDDIKESSSQAHLSKKSSSFRNGLRIETGRKSCRVLWPCDHVERARGIVAACHKKANPSSSVVLCGYGEPTVATSSDEKQDENEGAEIAKPLEKTYSGQMKHKRAWMHFNTLIAVAVAPNGKRERHRRRRREEGDAIDAAARALLRMQPKLERKRFCHLMSSIEECSTLSRKIFGAQEGSTTA
eukprot:3143586-Amphidinium_carterae.1